MFGLPTAVLLQGGAFVLAIVGLLWVVDEIGDRREAVVNARWEKKLANARLADQMKARARKIKQDEIAAKDTEALRVELELAREQNALLETQLGARPDIKDGKRIIVFPKDMIGAINK